MKWIFPAYAALDKICGPQRYCPDREYRMTTHCVRVPCEDGTLLFHTLMGSLCLLEPGETPENHLQELVAARYLVPPDFDDMRYSDTMRQLLRAVLPADTAKNDFTVLTTTDCNARCFYCYEMGCSRIPMTEQVAHDAAAYMAKACQGREIKLTWFGGEPLYNVSAIDIICGDLEKAGVSFRSRLISNGYFLDEAVARRAVQNWHLGSAQITLDGTEAVYNRTKAYIDCTENAFERVLQNIDAALNAGIRIYVRLNVDAQNAEDLLLLSDQLAERFRGRMGIGVYPILLQSFVGKIHDFESEEETVRRYTLLEDRLKKTGLWLDRDFQREISANQCMADNDACEVILPDGRIGMCEHFTETEIVGSIYDDARNEELIRAWKQRAEPYTECHDCPIYPRCINLKRCDWVRHGCPWNIRTIRMKHIEEQVLGLYRKQTGKVPTEQ